MADLALACAALVAAAVAALLVIIVRFSLADGDLTLISKSYPKRKVVEGKVVWITGASKGIGKEIAKQYASLGAKLILSARNVVDLMKVKNELETNNACVGVEVLPLDLESDEEALREAVETAETFFAGAGVEYMIHNAALDPPLLPALEITGEDVLTTIKTNVVGAVTITRILAPSMLKRGRGHFVVMSSAAGKVPAPGQSVYSASKFALHGYFHTLRSELCQYGIKVTVVCPGPIASKPEVYGNNSGEKPMPLDRCVRLILTAIHNGLKEVWIAHQPILLVMYLLQHAPTVGFWFMDKIGINRLEASAGEDVTDLMTILFGKKRAAVPLGDSAPLLG